MMYTKYERLTEMIILFNKSYFYSNLRSSFEKEIKDLILLQEEKILALKSETDQIHRMQMFEVEERKKNQIQNLIKNHDLAFIDMKNYYNDITLNNMVLVSALKEQIEALRIQCERSDRIAIEMSTENRKLNEPLEQLQKELVILNRKLEFSERDKAQLSRLKSRNIYIENHFKTLTWETEALLLRNNNLITERKEIGEKFKEAIIELQQKTSLRNVLLERKIAIIEKERKKQEMVLQETGDAFRTLGPEVDSQKQLNMK